MSANHDAWRLARREDAGEYPGRKEAEMFKTIIWATDGSDAADEALPEKRKEEERSLVGTGT
jgi:hypothetical protein